MFHTANIEIRVVDGNLVIVFVYVVADYHSAKFMNYIGRNPIVLDEFSHASVLVQPNSSIYIPCVFSGRIKVNGYKPGKIINYRIDLNYFFLFQECSWENLRHTFKPNISLLWGNESK